MLQHISSPPSRKLVVSDIGIRGVRLQSKAIAYRQAQLSVLIPAIRNSLQVRAIAAIGAVDTIATVAAVRAVNTIVTTSAIIAIRAIGAVAAVVAVRTVGAIPIVCA